MKSSFWLTLLALPVVAFVLAVFVGPHGLGCSEYAQYRSEACARIETALGVDLYWPSTAVVIYAPLFSLLTAPTFLVVWLRAIVRKRANA